MQTEYYRPTLDQTGHFTNCRAAKFTGGAWDYRGVFAESIVAGGQFPRKWVIKLSLIKRMKIVRQCSTRTVDTPTVIRGGVPYRLQRLPFAVGSITDKVLRLQGKLTEGMTQLLRHRL